jgi:hypothetical protein
MSPASRSAQAQPYLGSSDTYDAAEWIFNKGHQIRRCDISIELPTGSMTEEMVESAAVCLPLGVSVRDLRRE